MNWDNLEVDDWINMECDFAFYVDSYIDKVRVASKRFESVFQFLPFRKGT